MMFCAIFSTVTYISDQVTRNAIASSERARPENWCAQASRGRARPEASHRVSKKPGNSGAVCRRGGEGFYCQLLVWEKFPSQQPYKKTPFYKGQMAATCNLRKLLSYWITQCFIYVMCHCCKKNRLSSKFCFIRVLC